MMNPHLETRRTLAMAYHALADPIAAASGWQQQHLIDVQQRLYALWELESDAATKFIVDNKLPYYLATDTPETY
jgi:hypothetical protein